MEKSFEQQMERVAEIAGALDEGGVSLADSLKLYGEAVDILSRLKGELETAEGSVLVMRKDLDGFFVEDITSQQKT